MKLCDHNHHIGLLEAAAFIEAARERIESARASAEHSKDGLGSWQAASLDHHGRMLKAIQAQVASPGGIQIETHHGAVIQLYTRTGKKCYAATGREING